MNPRLQPVGHRSIPQGKDKPGTHDAGVYSLRGVGVSRPVNFVEGRNLKLQTPS